MKRFLIFLCLLLSFYGQAVIVGPVKMRGVIVSYNKKTVTLKSNGRTVIVPRRTISRKYKLKTGKKVYALLEPEDIASLLKSKKAR